MSFCLSLWTLPLFELSAEHQNLIFRLQRSLIMKACSPVSVRPDPKNCSIDFFHLQLCVVMGNHDIYIRTSPMWSLLGAGFRHRLWLKTGHRIKSVCCLKEPLSRSFSISAPNGVFSLFLSFSCSHSLSPVTCWNTFRSWVELLSAHSSLCVVFEDYYAQRHPHWASRQLRGQNP